MSPSWNPRTRYALTGVILLQVACASAVRSEYNPFCASVPRAHWLSHEEIRERLKESGFQLVRLRMADDRCIAVLVKDERGRTHDLIIHPVTAEFMR